MSDQITITGGISAAHTNKNMPGAFVINTGLYPARCLATKAMRDEIHRIWEAAGSWSNKDIYQYQMYKRFWYTPQSVTLTTWAEMSVWCSAITNYKPINAEERQIADAMRFEAQRHISENELLERQMTKPVLTERGQRSRSKNMMPIQA